MTEHERHEHKCLEHQRHGIDENIPHREERAMQASKLYSVGAAEVHVWCASSNDFEGWDSLEAVMSRSEKETARRFRHTENRQAYELAHGLLRHLLARYLNCDPAKLEFSREEYGKPCLTTRDLAFNLSHSGDNVAIAIARSAVGVDIEKIKTKQVDADLINRCLTASEQRWLHAETEDSQRRFFRLWTLKEATLKADGRGLGIGCHEAELSMSADGEAATVAIENATWKACGLPAGREYCLAVAAREIRNIESRTVRHTGNLEF